MPTQLSNVSVKVNGKSAYVYYISDTQINVLTPLDDTQGQVPIVVTNGNHRQRRLLPLRFDPRRPRSFWSAPASTPSQRTPTGRYWGPRRSRRPPGPSPDRGDERKPSPAPPFTITIRPTAPSFLLVGASKYAVATNANGSLLGPPSLSTTPRAKSRSW